MSVGRHSHPIGRDAATDFRRSLASTATSRLAGAIECTTGRYAGWPCTPYHGPSRPLQSESVADRKRRATAEHKGRFASAINKQSKGPCAPRCPALSPQGHWDQRGVFHRAGTTFRPSSCFCSRTRSFTHRGTKPARAFTHPEGIAARAFTHRRGFKSRIWLPDPGPKEVNAVNIHMH